MRNMPGIKQDIFTSFMCCKSSKISICISFGGWYTLTHVQIYMPKLFVLNISVLCRIFCQFILLQSHFYLTCKKLIFSRLQIFFQFFASWRIITPCKNLWGVIGVYKFSQEFSIIGVFWNILFKYQKPIPIKAA